MVFDKKIYEKEWRENNKDTIKEYSKKYRETHQEYIKDWNKNNKEWRREYRQSEKGQMINIISQWESRGIIYYDMKELYYTWKMTTHCNYCWCLLVEGRNGSNRKCLDHSHKTGEPRGVICHACNIKDVFKNC